MSLKRSLLLCMLICLSLLSAVVMAANDPPPASSQDPASSQPPPKGPASSEPPTSSTTTQGKTISNTNTGTTTTTTPTGAMPTISGGNTGPVNTGKLTGLPTLSKTAQTGIPTYPPPAVPPTENAPFMNKSTLPDGTVFIAVGAILGAFGMAVLLWRGIVACLLHRSVERAALAQHAANDKVASSFPAPPAPFYTTADRESSPSLAVGSVSGRGQRRTNRGPIPSSTPSQTNLFFSPTAPGGMGSSNNRDSRFLPSGFYASGSPAPGHGHGTSISLSNLRPSSRGHSTAMGPSPPDSPAARASPVPRNNFSTSSLNLPPTGRAPSAYLDDLLDEQGGQLPPPGQFPSGHQHTYSQSSLGRF